MGFECFLVKLIAPPITAAEIESYLLAQPEISIDHESLRIGNSKYFHWNDGQHIVEIELSLDPVQLSTRFMLCHPDSIVAAYTQLLRKLLLAFGGELMVCDDVPPNCRSVFTYQNLDEFPEVLRNSIAARRAEWVAMFGPQTRPATSRTAFEEYILPTCSPVSAPLTSTH